MRYRLKNAISHIAHAGTTNLMGIGSIAFITVLLTTLLLNHVFILRESEFKGKPPTLVAFLKDTVDEPKGRNLVSQLEKNTQILAINYVSKAEKLARSQTDFQKLGPLIQQAFAEIRGINPFPASLEIYVVEASVTRKTLEQIALDIKAHNEIEDVSLTGQGLGNDLLRNSERTTFVGSGLAIVAIWGIIRYALGKTAAARNEEIALMKLLGAGPRYLRTPFFIHGIFLGGIGPLCGLACFYGLFQLFKSQLGTLRFLTIHQPIFVVVGGIGIGIVAALSAQRKCV